MSELDIIEKRVMRARKWAEKYARRHLFPSSLCGLCAIASIHLFKQLKAAGIETVICAGTNHCFLMRGNTIIDITASQFGEGLDSYGIVMLPMPSSPPVYWKVRQTFTDARQYRSFQESEGWPEEQLAYL